VAALEYNIGFRAYDEECGTEREDIETLKINVAAVHDVDGPGLRQNLVEDVDVMHFPLGNTDKRGDVAVQVQQRVHFDSGFVLAKLGPGKQRKAQVDGGRVQRVQTLIQIYTDRIGRIQRPRDADQHLREVGVDAPVMRVVGIGQRGARHAAVKPHVVELAAQRAQTSFYVPKAIPIRQLGKGHRQNTGPNKRILAVAHRRRTAPRNGEIRDPAGSSATERKRFGPGSRTIVAPAGTSFWALPPFKSRQAKSRYNSMHQRGL